MHLRNLKNLILILVIGVLVNIIRILIFWLSMSLWWTVLNRRSHPKSLSKWLIRLVLEHLVNVGPITRSSTHMQVRTATGGWWMGREGKLGERKRTLNSLQIPSFQFKTRLMHTTWCSSSSSNSINSGPSLSNSWEHNSSNSRICQLICMMKYKVFIKLRWRVTIKIDLWKKVHKKPIGER